MIGFLLTLELRETASDEDVVFLLEDFLQLGLSHGLDYRGWGVESDKTLLVVKHEGGSCREEDREVIHSLMENYRGIIHKLLIGKLININEEEKLNEKVLW